MTNLNRRSLRHMIMTILDEHRVAPDIPALSSRELGNLNSIIDAGDQESIEMARSLIDVDEFGVDVDSYIDDYLEYSGVGDIEKMGNQAAILPPDDADDMDSEMEDWATLHAAQMSPDNEDEYYDMLMNRYYTNKNRGLSSNIFLKEGNNMKNLNRMSLRRMILTELSRLEKIRMDYPSEPSRLEKMRMDYPSEPSIDIDDDLMRQPLPDMDIEDEEVDHDLEDFDDHPLNRFHLSERRQLRRMILAEMAGMGVGSGQPPMSIDAMMQELQSIESQLEEMEMERQEYILNQERYGADPIEAAYAFEYGYPDYYDDKEELQSRAYELEEMIEAAGGPTL